MEQKRVVVTFSGSDSDGPQMVDGLDQMKEALANDELACLARILGEGLDFKPVQVGHYILSCHRNTRELLDSLKAISKIAKSQPDIDFILVMGAGMAAALPGITSAYLAYDPKYKVANVFVVGVAFEYLPKEDDTTIQIPSGSMILNDARSALQIFAGMSKKQRRDLAAILSITELPGNRVIYEDNQGIFFGADGWTRACQYARNGFIPQKLRELPDHKDSQFLEWVDAVQRFSQMAA